MGIWSTFKFSIGAGDKIAHYKKRPRCRKAIFRILDRDNCSLNDLLHKKKLRISKGMRFEIMKMISELNRGI